MLLGISNGYPLLLVGSTLNIWLLEEGITKTTIGLFTLVSLPYTIKFLWAPFMDHIHLPYFANKFGHRRSWTVLTQILLAISVVGLGYTDPSDGLFWTALMASFVTFFSASQDIVIEAIRVESLEDEEQATGAANIMLGFRIGMLLSGAGALYMAEVISWATVYSILACTTLIGIITIICIKEPNIREQRIKNLQPHETVSGFLKKAIIEPFQYYMSKPNWGWIFALIILYKAGEVLLSKMCMPFYTEVGFTKTEIASVTKIYGLFAIIIGGLIGGAIASSFGILRSMMICGIPQMLTNLLYVVLAYIGYDIKMLIVAVTFDNLTAGMATACLVVFLSKLCSKGLAASQYALLSSFTAISHKYFGALSGFLADHMDWPTFFMLTTFACMPGLYLLSWMMVKNAKAPFLPAEA